MNLTREQIERAPAFTATIKESIGSVSTAIEAMRFSAAPCILKFLQHYDSLSDQARKLPCEAIAISAEVSIPELLGETLLAYKELQSRKSAMKVMKEHPTIVDKTIKFAKSTRGIADRRIIHEAVGFLPTKMGVSINQVFGTLPKQQAALPPPPDPGGQTVELADIVSPITDDLEQWQGNRSKLLKGGTE